LFAIDLFNFYSNFFKLRLEDQGDTKSFIKLYSA